ncbi:MAG: hypothetical protein WB809_04145, partial [Thermoplasmata archaeon]
MAKPTISLEELFGPPLPPPVVWRLWVGMRGHERGFRVGPGDDGTEDRWVPVDRLSREERAAAVAWELSELPEVRGELVSP